MNSVRALLGWTGTSAQGSGVVSLHRTSQRLKEERRKREGANKGGGKTKKEKEGGGGGVLEWLVLELRFEF